MKSSAAALLAVGLVVLSACADDGPAGTIPTGSTAADTDGGSSEFDIAAAETYCTDNGGMLVPRVATWNTNADRPAWLELAGRTTFCEFDSGGADSSRISVDLVTLYSEEPTIAAIAYLSAIEVTLPEAPSANPAEHSCRVDLLGSSAFGNTATVGGWVNTEEPIFEVMNMCVFTDLSAIDEFGLWYHANGQIRGTDLAEIMRYQPGRRLPAMFADAS